MEVEKERRHVEITWYYSAHYSAHLKLLIHWSCKSYTFTHLWLRHFYHLIICQFASYFKFLDFNSRLVNKNTFLIVNVSFFFYIQTKENNTNHIQNIFFPDSTEWETVIETNIFCIKNFRICRSNEHTSPVTKLRLSIYILL